MAVVNVSSRPLWTEAVPGIGVPGLKAHAVNRLFPEPAGVYDGYATVCGTESRSMDLRLEPPDDLQAACKLCHRTMRARFGSDATWLPMTVVRVLSAADVPTFEERLDRLRQLDFFKRPDATGTGRESLRRTVPLTSSS